MEEFISNTTIAVIMVYLACHEVKYSWSKTPSVPAFAKGAPFSTKRNGGECRGNGGGWGVVSNALPTRHTPVHVMKYLAALRIRHYVWIHVQDDLVR